MTKYPQALSPEGDQREARRYHHGDLKNALIREGRNALEEIPAHELTLRLVARRAGVSQAAPARHFDGLNELLAAIALEGFRELVAARQRVVETNEPTRRKMALMMRCYIDFARANKGMFALMVGHRLVHRSDHRELYEMRQASFDLFAQSVCDFARDCGWPESAMNLLVHSAWSTEHGAAVLINAERVPAFHYEVELDPMVDFSVALLQSGIERGPGDLPPPKG